MTGRRTDAVKLRDELRGLSTGRYVPTSYFAYIELYLGNKDQAITLLRKAVEEKDGIMSYLNVEPKLDPLRSDPRFTELLRKANLIR